MKKTYRTIPILEERNKETITYSPYHPNPKISLFFRKLFTDFDYTNLDKDKVTNIYLSYHLLIDKKYYDIINYFTENYNVYIYIPTIIKANYKNLILNSLDQILTTFNIKGFIVSNIADCNFLKKYAQYYEFIGNYSLNVFNNETIEQYKNLGLSRITLSRELNQDSINKILETTNLDTELIVYGNLPVMATSYCFLGKTNNCYPECGTNCKKQNTYYLKDRMDFKFRVIPDSLQTVTLICNSKTLSISTEDIPISYVRADIIDEDIDKINEIINKCYNRTKFEGPDFTNGNLYKQI